MTKTKRNSDCLEALPQCERLIQFDETPTKMIGGFNTLLVGKNNQMYLANIEGETLVLEQGRMPLAEADTTILKSISVEAALKWFERAWRTAQDRLESCDATALDTFAGIVAAALRS